MNHYQDNEQFNWPTPADARDAEAARIAALSVKHQAVRTTSPLVIPAPTKRLVGIYEAIGCVVYDKTKSQTESETEAKGWAWIATCDSGKTARLIAESLNGGGA